MPEVKLGINLDYHFSKNINLIFLISGVDGYSKIVSGKFSPPESLSINAVGNPLQSFFNDLTFNYWGFDVELGLKFSYW